MSRRTRAVASEDPTSPRKSRRLHRFPTSERLAAPFLSLPDVVRYQICRYLDVRSVLRLAMTSKEMAQRMPWRLLAADLLARDRELLRDARWEVNPDVTMTHQFGRNPWHIPLAIKKMILQQVDELRALAQHDTLPETSDYQRIYRLLASACCIVCSKYCAPLPGFWFGHRMCYTCYAFGARGDFYKLIPLSDAKLKYKQLDLDGFCVQLLRGKSSSTKPIATVWERQLVLAARSGATATARKKR